MNTSPMEVAGETGDRPDMKSRIAVRDLDLSDGLTRL